MIAAPASNSAGTTNSTCFWTLIRPSNIATKLFRPRRQDRPLLLDEGHPGGAGLCAKQSRPIDIDFDKVELGMGGMSERFKQCGSELHLPAED